MLVACLQAKSVNANKLLDEVISHPGSYTQTCDVITIPSDVPYPAMQIKCNFGAEFSMLNEKKISENRAGLIKAIRTHLSSIDFTREPQEQESDPSVSKEEQENEICYGADPKALNPLILKIIVNLHAIETLPELLAVEQRLVDAIAKTKDDIKVIPPWVDGFDVVEVGGYYDENEPNDAKRMRRIRLFKARVAQRDLVILIASLMREKAYKPYLETNLEATYVEGLKADAKKNGYDKVKPGPNMPKEIDNWSVTFDPITKIVHKTDFSCPVPYSRESRDQIRSLAAKWIAEHP
jgi:hypothetical protein